jgi:hypothetical protein
MKPPYEKLRLTDVVPGKNYLFDRSENQVPTDLISFMCSKERGALRGFVRVFIGSTEIFPTNGVKLPRDLSVIATNQGGITYRLPVEFCRYSGVLALTTKSVLINPNLSEIRSNLEYMIEEKEREIDKLRNTYHLLNHSC